MLCQLVCVDRRYQRMNCFNIRELQGILKRKFFTDLVTTMDSRELLNQTLIGVRFKTNQLNSANTDYSIAYNYNTTVLPKIKSLNYISFDEYFAENFFSIGSSFLKLDNFNFKNIYFLVYEFMFYFKSKSTDIWYIFNIENFLHIFNSCSTIFTLNTNFSNPFYLLNGLSYEQKFLTKAAIFYQSENISTTVDKVTQFTKMSELTSTYRYLRFYNPIISYDYKTGNYIGS